MNELKSCPFCGGKAIFNTKNNSSSHYEVGFDFTIKCSECGIELPKSYSIRFTLGEKGNIEPQNKTREEAVEDWNKRV